LLGWALRCRNTEPGIGLVALLTRLCALLIRAVIKQYLGSLKRRSVTRRNFRAKNQSSRAPFLVSNCGLGTVTKHQCRTWWNILIVEDNEILREELALYLGSDQWRVRAAADGLQADELLLEHDADIVILDLNLPMEDGLSIAARLRRSYPNMGIIMLTARNRQSQRAEGYESGADVYLTKPASMPELKAVVTNLARRLVPRPAHSEAASAAQLAGVGVNLATAGTAPSAMLLDVPRLKLSLATGQSLLLTPAETQLLHTLALAGGQVVDTDALLTQLESHQNQHWSKANLSVGLSRLRQRVQEQLGKDLQIKSVRGIGYQLGAPPMSG
jgi:DNA-binding response OmpR family regulator